MKKVSIYRPTSIDEAIQILSTHGMDSGVYAGGTDLLIRLKNRLKQAPSYLVHRVAAGARLSSGEEPALAGGEAVEPCLVAHDVERAVRPGSSSGYPQAAGRDTGKSGAIHYARPFLATSPAR